MEKLILNLTLCVDFVKVLLFVEFIPKGKELIIIIIIINNRLFVFTLLYKNNYDVNSYVRHGMN